MATQAGRLIGSLTACVLGLSAALFFSVQPMIGKLLLPSLGGAPQVWLACLVFFQAALLAGYVLAWLTARLSLRIQALLYVLAVAAGAACAVFTVPPFPEPLAGAWPSLALLAILAGAVGVPTMVLAMCAPLVQRWYSGLGLERSTDPYFLYAVSNAGSLAALIGYPLAVEPLVGLRAQFSMWVAAYGLLAVLAAALVSATWSRGGREIVPPANDEPVTSGRAGQWLMLALVPSMLTVGVTNTITSDVAAVPLVWIAPLALFLGSSVVAFARRAREVPGPSIALAAFAGLSLSAIAADVARPPWLVLPVHLMAFTLASLRCQEVLAASRPSAARLSAYYVWVALGGVLGGGLAALAAPVLFRTPAEYPVALVAALLVSGWAAPQGRRFARGVAMPVGLGLLCVAMLLGGTALGLHPGTPLLAAAAVGGPFALACVVLRRTPVTLALAFAAIVMPALLVPRLDPRLEHIERSAFGVRRVVRDGEGAFRLLVDGRSVQGVQSLTARREPVASYHRSGPVGDVFRALHEDRTGPQRLAVIGLGVGAVACYLDQGDTVVFIEIDPVVARIATDQRFFTFLHECEGRHELRVGDGRVVLERLSGPFDLIVLDAFSGGAVPAHLFTREALDAYRRRLSPSGAIFVHLPSQFVDLEPVLGAAAGDLGLEALVRRDRAAQAADWSTGWAPSTWMLLRRPLPGRAPAGWPGWRRAEARGRTAWTDDRSSVLPVLTLR